MPETRKEPYFHEREGARPAPTEEVTSQFWDTYVRYLKHLRDRYYLTEAFHMPCPISKRGVHAEFDSSALDLQLRAEIGVSWPFSPKQPPETPLVLSVIEFFAARVSRPLDLEPSLDIAALLGHKHFIGFDPASGRDEYTDYVNRLFVTSRLSYELKEGKVARTGSLVFAAELRSAIFATGDGELDKLLENARTLYFQPGEEARQSSVEKLWDSWERLKTLGGKDKADGAASLLSASTSIEPVRKLLEDEAKQLTFIGNNYRIRHHETDKFPLASPEDQDYVFQRMFSLIWRILRVQSRSSRQVQA